MIEELLRRYTENQRKVINEYWDTIRFTRRTCKISEGIKKNELEYWNKFEAEKVIEALRIHITKYPNHRENYTRGILRNIKDTRTSSAAQQPNQRPTFNNFRGREYDAKELKERLLKKSRGEL